MAKNDVLGNANHECFVKYIIAGEQPGSAYKKVYGNRLNSTQCAQRLLANPRVLSRISYLRMKLSETCEKEAISFAKNAITRDFRNKQTRIEALAVIAEKLELVMRKRAELYSKLPSADFKLPGHETGIIIPVFSAGKMTSQVDNTIIKEYRATIQQINEEVGPDRIDWAQDDGLKELARALEASPTKPPSSETGTPEANTGQNEVNSEGMQSNQAIDCTPEVKSEDPKSF